MFAELIMSLLLIAQDTRLMAQMLVWIVDTIQKKDEAKAKTIYGACGVTLVDAMRDGDQTAEAAEELLERSTMKMAHMAWMIDA